MLVRKDVIANGEHTPRARLCSFCRTLGHTRKDCPKRHSGPLPVWVADNALSSPHIVDLHAPSRWQEQADTPVYEAPVAPPDKARVLVDFAAAIRTANQQLPPPEAIPQKIASKSVFVRSAKKAWRQSGADWWQRCVSLIRQFLFTKRSAYVLLTVALLLIVPFPAFGYYQYLKDANALLIGQSTTGFLALHSSTVAVLRADIPTAEANLTVALAAFGAANAIIEKDHPTLFAVASVLPGLQTAVVGRTDLLQAGEELTIGNAALVKGMAEVSQADTRPLTDRLQTIHDYVQGAAPHYERALGYIEQIPLAMIPAAYQQPFSEFRVLLSAAVGDIRELAKMTTAFNQILGDESFRRYLIVFQNPHELRPTGGFMGSFAVLDIEKGKITNVRIPGGGTYDLRGQLPRYVRPPLPLQLVNQRWEFQDANWFPDFAASAEKIAWFYRQARNETVDGVIAVNATVLERLLAVLGPVAEAKSGMVLSAADAIPTLEETVEAAKHTAAPKQIIGAVLTQLLHHAPTLHTTDLIRLLTSVHEAAVQKEIQLYFTDQNVETAFQELGWTGDMAQIGTGEDYLSVSVANLEGEKSDAKIHQKITHNAVVSADGTVIVTTHLTRTHTGTPGELLYGKDHIGYVRFYVPAGATLLDAGGFSFPPETAFHVPETWYANDTDQQRIEKEEQLDVKTGTRITAEFGKTVFGNWIHTGPGETTEVYVTYRLPWRVFAPRSAPRTDLVSLASAWLGDWTTEVENKTSRYSLLLQKQSGVNADLAVAVEYPSDWSPSWSSNTDIDLHHHGFSYEGSLIEDQALGVLMTSR